MYMPVAHGEPSDPAHADCVEDLLAVSDFAFPGVHDEVLRNTLRTMAQGIVGRWTERYNGTMREHGYGGALHPVAKVFVAARQGEFSPDETIDALAASTKDARGRAIARTALLTLGREDLEDLVLAFTGEGVVYEFEDQEAVATYAWDPARFHALDQIPEAARALFPLEDMPAYQDYMTQETIFCFGDRELVMLGLLDDAKIDMLELSEYRVPVVNAGVQVAIYRWRIAADADYGPVDEREIEYCKHLFTYFVRAGGYLDADLALEDALDEPASRAVFVEALEAILLHGDDAQREHALRTSSQLLDSSDFVLADEIVAATDDPERMQEIIDAVSDLRMHVALLTTMESARRDPGGPGELHR